MARKIVYPDAEESVSSLLAGERLAKLEALGEFEAFYGARPDDDTFMERIGDADMVISGWGLSNAVLAAVPRVEIISFTGLGASTFIDLSEAARRGITVTHVLSAASTIAEHTMGLMLDAARHIGRFDRDLRRGNWNMDLECMDLRGKTLGLVGFGRIAQAVAPLAKAFGMQVISWTRNPDPARAERFGIRFVELDDLLAGSDVVSLHLLSNPETNGLLNAQKLRLMKPSAILINTARSKILDEATLANLLETGHIRAAGIDVFDQEPMPADHPFTRLDNVIMTPHVAYNSPEALEEMYDTAIDNLVAYDSGNPQNVATLAEA